MALQISAITSSIAALSVNGVRIVDKNEIKEGWDAYDCPVLSPRPSDFITAPQVESVSFGSGSTNQLNVSYTLGYRFFYAPVGSGDLLQTWSEMVDKLFLIFDAINANDAINGLIDLTLTDVSQFDVVEDAAGNQFLGCDIALRVLEFVN
jgi:hypothetical protein